MPGYLASTVRLVNLMIQVPPDTAQYNVYVPVHFLKALRENGTS
jgi:hypothetical protein